MGKPDIFRSIKLMSITETKVNEYTFRGDNSEHFILPLLGAVCGNILLLIDEGTIFFKLLLYDKSLI